MMLMLRRSITAILAGFTLALIPLVAHADTSLVSPNNSASVLQPSPSQSIQTGADQSSSASAAYLNDELVGGQQGTQTSDSATPSFPWGEVIAATLLAAGLIGLLVILYRSRPRQPQVVLSEPVAPPARPAKPKPKTKSKAKSKPSTKSKAKKK